MLNLQQIQQIAETQNVIFYKPNCSFCIASKDLFDRLISLGVLENYQIYTLDKDFDNQTLTDLVCIYGWKPDGIQSFCSKPQIFIKSEYIGGNFEFYKSKWNIDTSFPNLKNPMRF